MCGVCVLCASVCVMWACVCVCMCVCYGHVCVCLCNCWEAFLVLQITGYRVGQAGRKYLSYLCNEDIKEVQQRSRLWGKQQWEWWVIGQ